MKNGAGLRRVELWAGRLLLRRHERHPVERRVDARGRGHRASSATAEGDRRREESTLARIEPAQREAAARGGQVDAESLDGVLAQAVASELQADAFAVLEQVGDSHPTIPHWYLPAIGVEPMMQRKGYGSVLMEHGVSVCDDQKVAAYLESTNPTNIPLYERFGFDVVG